MDDSQSKRSKPRDRLSELPDSLIHHILSFLPMRDVVRTTLLSKRWEDLWTTVPCLDFTDDEKSTGRLQDFERWEDLWTTVRCLDFTDDEKSTGRLQDFVNRTLILWKGTKILKFDIAFFFNPSASIDLDLWLRVAMKNEVEELSVNLINVNDVTMCSGDTEYWAPQRLYSCSSIRKLTLVACNLQINGKVQWNKLKSLRIEGVCLSEHMVNQILSGTPLLEVLKLCLLECYDNLNIQSSSLKKLTIQKYLYMDNEPATDTVLRIWAPKVETLVISGVLYSKCLLMNVSSLTDATLGFDVPKYYDNDVFPWNELLGEMLREIFPTIHLVEKVTLSDCCIKVLGVMEKKYLLSSSSDVKFLKLNSIFIELNEMVNVLEIFPKMKTLNKIVNVLEIFPKMKTLVIEHIYRSRFNAERCSIFQEFLHWHEWDVIEALEFDADNYLESETNFPKSFLQQLRTVEITWFFCDASIFPLIVLLLKHASMLEMMVIRARQTIPLPPESWFLVEQKLLSMPRSSPTAEVILLEE